MRIGLPFILAAVWSAIGSAAEPVRPAGIPDTFELLYEQAFSDPSCLSDFQFTDPKVWRLGRSDDGSTYLEHFAQSKYVYPVRSPYNIALFSHRKVKDFLLDLDVQQTGREYGHRDLCVFFGFQDRSHFYYAHIATKTDPNAHNIFIVNGADRVKISTTTTQGHDWGTGWHTLRVVRDSLSGQISVFVNDLNQPIMTATDRTFDWGLVGFGSFDDTGRVRQMRLWTDQSKIESSARKLFQ